VTSPSVTASAATLTELPTSVSISGKSQTDQTVTVNPGTWGPSVTVTYQWLRDNEPINGATASTYTLTSSDVGRAISARVTGAKPGYTTESLTSTPVLVTVAPFVSSTPTISGVFASGQTLTANPGAWTPGASFTYQWLRNGASITGATRSTYRLISSDVGKQISVKVTGRKAGYTPASAAKTSTKSAKVMQAATPKISGTLAVGSTLKLSRGSWTSSVSFSYQWVRDGITIPGATRTYYKLTSTDAGKKITVRVTGRRSGYATVALTSAATAKVMHASTPTISGTPTVGKTLTANPGGTWTSGTTFTHQWYASGRTISGATGNVFTLTGSQKGKTMTVKVTGRQSGYATIAKTSAATARIT
jgi:hypothetical protein